MLTIDDGRSMYINDRPCRKIKDHSTTFSIFSLLGMIQYNIQVFKRWETSIHFIEYHNFVGSAP
jgi:hypothetical protein